MSDNPPTDGRLQQLKEARQSVCLRTKSGEETSGKILSFDSGTILIDKGEDPTQMIRRCDVANLQPLAQ